MTSLATLLAQLPLALLQDGAAPATESAPGLLDSILVPLVLVVAVFYFLMIRPERKKQKARQATLDALKKNDRVMTTSGMYGRVAALKDDEVTLQVADNVRIRFNRAAIQDVLSDEKPDDAKGGAKARADEPEKVSAGG